MILTCSSCSTRFLVDAAAIGPAGRHVRCARCQHGWFQEPAADLPRQAPAETGTGGPSGPALDAMGETAPPRGRPAPLRRGANLPALPRRTGRIMERLAWGALALFAASLAGAGYMFREQIIHAWPQAARLYAAAGIDSHATQLRLTDVSFSQGEQGGHPALTVIGAISNDGSEETLAPQVVVTLRNAAGKDIFQWTHQLPEKTLAAGATVKFETSLADPPSEARNLEVTFTPGR